MRKLDKIDVEKSSSVYWSSADWVLSLGPQAPSNKEHFAQQLASYLNYHSLFSEYICVPDITLLNNSMLGELFYKDYHPLLSNSIVVPMCRSSMKNFSALDEQSHLDKTLYGMLERNKSADYADFLDDKVSAILPMDQKILNERVTHSFNQTLLNIGFLREINLSKINRKLNKYINTYYKEYDTEYLRRSVFFFFADELKQDGHSDYSEKIKLLSTFIYHRNFVNLSNLTPELPYDRLDALLSISARNIDKYIPGNNSNNKELFKEVDSKLKNLSLNLNDLDWFKPYDIVEIRKSNEAKSYFNEIKKVHHECDHLRATNKLIEALSSYIEYLNLQLAYKKTGKTKIQIRNQSYLKWVKGLGLGGSIAITALGGGIVGGVAFKLIWNIPQSYIESKVKKDERHVLSKHEEIKKLNEIKFKEISFQDKTSILTK